jgi:hypothetical protein
MKKMLDCVVGWGTKVGERWMFSTLGHCSPQVQRHRLRRLSGYFLDPNIRRPQHTKESKDILIIASKTACDCGLWKKEKLGCLGFPSAMTSSKGPRRSERGKLSSESTVIDGRLLRSQGIKDRDLDHTQWYIHWYRHLTRMECLGLASRLEEGSYPERVAGLRMQDILLQQFHLKCSLALEQ